ncbi:Methyl-CpG DNA binding [Trema orientale]|uniref:Methyl-CpG DNA binding n=1 Tax=Trema orientale TaxID=63057 RepID=A0A2P5ELM0_TREOI|nr:Methyl-CpG DNA binding [Trema orientale]
MVAKKSPEPLPAGWTVQFKAQKTGRKVRVYTNLETGKEFFSKDDVFNYIKAGSHHPGKPQSTNGNTTTEAEKIPLQPVNDKDDLPEWLPKGWKVAVKTRKSGLLIGKEYKVYINPFNSCKFYSKQEVLRYLKTLGRKTHRTRDVETVKGKSCIPNKETDTSMCSADKVVVQKCEVEDLPSGWIKEIRIRKTSNVIRKDPYYTDPVTGYIFRSKKAALHYVETGEISRHVIKPKNSEELVKDDSETSSAAKRQKLEHPASRRQLFAGKMGSDTSNLELSKTFGSKITGAKRVSPEAAVTFSSRDEITQGKQPLDNATQECGETKEKDAPKRSSLLKAEGSTSGGDKMSLLSDAGVSDKSRGKNDFAKNRPLSTPAPDVLQEKNFLGTAMEKSSVRETRANSRKSKDKEVRNLPPRSSKRLAGIEPDQLMNLDMGERALKTEILKSRKSEAIQDAGMTSDGLVDGASAQLETRPETELVDHVSTNTNDSLHRDPSNKSLKPFEDQVAPEDLHLNLETEKINDNPEPQLSFLFGSDPCLEFAFKTLLGELPLDDTPLEDPISTEAGGTLQDDLLESKMEKKGTRRGRVSRSKSKNKKTLLGELPRDDTPLVVEPILTEAGGTLQQDMLESEIEKSSTGRGQVGRNRSKNNKTLLGELPLDDSPLVKPILTEAGSTLQHDLLENEMEKSSTGKGRVTRHKSKNKKEPNLPRRSSKRLAGVEPEVMSSPVASERALPNASRNPNEESITSSTNLLDEADPGPEIELQTQLSNTDTSVQAEPLNKMESSYEDLAVPQDQQRMHETQKEEVEKAEPNLSFSFVDYWSDPCLDFAFKTLTGIIPIEDSFVQGDFQPQVDISHNHRNSNLALPDFGSPSLFQTDISSQFDAPEKSVLGQQSPVTPTFLPAGNVNFPSCSGVRSQQQCLEGNKDLHQKVKS